MGVLIWSYIEKWCKEEFVDDEGDDMVVLTPEAKKLKDKWIEEGRIGIISSILSRGLSF